MTDFKEQQILVTGGAGFIGSHIVDRLMRDGAYVRVLDDLSEGSLSNIAQWKDDPKFEMVQGDIRDESAVKESLTDVEIVFHHAALISVPLSVTHPLNTINVNVDGTTCILDGSRRADVTKVVFASSAAVYGNPASTPIAENALTDPISPYAASKLMGEQVASSFYRTYGIDTTSLRYFNVYGPRQKGGPYAGVITAFINMVLAAKPVLIQGDGGQTRDFVYVDDVVRFNLLAALSPKSRGQVYNVGGGSQVSIGQLADAIIGLGDSKCAKEYGDPRVGDVRDSFADITKANRDIGYSPKVSLEDGVRQTFEWFRKSLS